MLATIVWRILTRRLDCLMVMSHDHPKGSTARWLAWACIVAGDNGLVDHEGERVYSLDHWAFRELIVTCTSSATFRSVLLQFIAICIRLTYELHHRSNGWVRLTLRPGASSATNPSATTSLTAITTDYYYFFAKKWWQWPAVVSSTSLRILQSFYWTTTFIWLRNLWNYSNALLYMYRLMRQFWPP